MRRRSGFWYLLDAPTQRFGICLSDIGDSAGNVERHVERLADVVRGEIVAVVQPLQEGDVVLIAQAVGEAETVDRVACDELVRHDLVVRTGGGVRGRSQRSPLCIYRRYS